MELISQNYLVILLVMSVIIWVLLTLRLLDYKQALKISEELNDRILKTNNSLGKELQDVNTISKQRSKEYVDQVNKLSDDILNLHIKQQEEINEIQAEHKKLYELVIQYTNDSLQLLVQEFYKLDGIYIEAEKTNSTVISLSKKRKSFKINIKTIVKTYRSQIERISLELNSTDIKS